MRQRGLTLVEMAITLAILIIMVAAALPAFNEMTQNTQIRTAAETLVAGLQTARAEALRRNEPVQFTVLGDGAVGETGWEVRVRNSNLLVQSKVAGEASTKAQLTMTPSDARTVTFSSLGRVLASNADGSARLTRIDIDNPSLAADKSRDLRVVISDGGSVRMCDPATSGSDTRAC